MKQLFLLIFITITSVSFSQSDYYLAEDYYREGEYEKATQIFKNLYAKNLFNTTYLSRLISCYQETNKFSEVEKLLNEKEKLSGEEVEIVMGRGFGSKISPKTIKVFLVFRPPVLI